MYIYLPLTLYPTMHNFINLRTKYIYIPLVPYPLIHKMYLPSFHSISIGLKRWHSSMLTNALQVRSQPGTDYFVLSVCCFVWLLVSLCYQEYSYIHMGELTVWIVFPIVAIRVHRSSPLVPLDSCLTAAACLSTAY